MKCEIIRDLLPLYADGLTSEESNQLIEEHIQSCAECAALAKSMCAPLETEFTPSQEVYDCVEAIYRRERKRKIRTVVACVLTAVIVFGGCWYYTKKRYRTEEWKETELSQEEILEQIPELALTDKELELAATIWRTPELREYLSSISDEDWIIIPYEQVEKYFLEVVPEDAKVGQVGLTRQLFYVDYFQKDTRITLSYVDGDMSGYADRVEKGIAVLSEDREVETVYSVNYDTAWGETSYEKRQPKPHRYDFLFE